MQRIKRSYIGFILAAIIFGCIYDMPIKAATPSQYQKADSLTVGNYTYFIEDGKAIITEYLGAGGSVAIPSELGGYPVAEIGCHYNGITDVGAFYGNTTVTSVTIPAGVVSVGIAAFRDCVNITDITFSQESQLTIIDVYAFQGCSSLSSLTIPEGVTTIRRNAFAGCTLLANITYPDTVISVSGDTLKDTKWFTDQADGPVYNNKVLIGYKGTNPVSGVLSVRSGTVAIAGWAFYNCAAVTSLSIPAETVYIGESAFYGCTNLAAVQLAADSALYHMGDYVFKNTVWMNTRPVGIVMLGNVLCGYSGEMPVGYDLVVGDNVFSIASNALGWLPNLRSITIPAGVRYIAYCETLVSPSCRISPFMQNESLQSITVSAENPNYSSDEFGVLYDKNKTELIQYPCGNNRENFTVPDTVKVIRGSAFGSNNAVTALKKVDLKNVKRIEYSAFLNCKNLVEISLPENLAHLGESSFSGCRGIVSIRIPLTITEIRSNSFINCIKLQNVTIPESVKFIGNRAFYNCNSLEWISLPKSVISIADRAFSYCTALTAIIIPESVKDINSATFLNSPNRTIYGFAGSYAQTFATNNSISFAIINETTDGWQYYTNGGKVKIIRYAGSGTMVTVPATISGNPVTVIGTRAFFGNTALTFVMIPSGVTEIGDHAFYSCSFLKRVYISETVNNVKSKAFGLCENMISIYFKGQPPTPGTDMFEGAQPNFGIYYCGAIEFNGPEWNSYWRVRVNPGDVSGDWVVNMADAVALVQQLARGFPAQYEERANIAADVVRDGRVNMADIVKLVQALANPSIVLD